MRAAAGPSYLAVKLKSREQVAEGTMAFRFGLYFRGWLDSGQPRCIAFGGMSVNERKPPTTSLLRILARS